MIIKNSHENNISPAREIIISMHLFKNFLYIIAHFLNIFVKSKLLYPYNNHIKKLYHTNYIKSTKKLFIQLKSNCKIHKDNKFNKVPKSRRYTFYKDIPSAGFLKFCGFAEMQGGFYCINSAILLSIYFFVSALYSQLITTASELLTILKLG